MKARPTLVERVRDGLLADLLAGGFPSGAKLPNEQELAERFEVSRATVREAVRGLHEAGYLTRRHGSGTYVTGLPRRRHALDLTVSYTAMIREAGMQPGEQLLGADVRHPDADEARRLGLGPAEQVISVERIRTADGRPVIYSLDRIPQQLLADVAEPLDRSLYATLEAAGAGVRTATAALRPVVADERLAALLKVRVGSPIQRIDQIDFDAAGRPVMLSAEWHVPDIFELHVNRRARGPEPVPY
jgi:GntR family transcriptional regulator